MDQISRAKVRLIIEDVLGSKIRPRRAEDIIEALVQNGFLIVEFSALEGEIEGAYEKVEVNTFIPSMMDVQSIAFL